MFFTGLQLHISSHVKVDESTNEICKHTGLTGSESSEENIQCLHLLCANEFRIPSFCSCQHMAHALGHTRLNHLGHYELSKGLTLT